MKKHVLKCAIYTRKSSDEGLDQDFNSLDAQRESCDAYITSQKAEGWSLVKKHYDDGGFSGGSLERPALKALLDDIRAGRVDIVVVYKIDRLTRSLMDFSKLVEIFDEHGVTFVSITQSFNTTTSMGRLTLNVLLSFAQFEREVAGERIRDKIAASKAKGMWMGGRPPLGYDIENRQLIVNEEDAKTARMIFELYLECGCVKNLKQELARRNVKSCPRVSKRGLNYGGKNFSRGALYNFLKNPVYIGKIKHHDQIHDGMHEAIISDELWYAVQDKLRNQAAHPRGTNKESQGNLLMGLIYTPDDSLYTPIYTKKKNKKYRYYFNQNLTEDKNHPQRFRARLPAHDLEKTVENAIRSELQTPEKLMEILELDMVEDRHMIDYLQSLFKNKELSDFYKVIQKIIVHQDRLEISIHTKALSILFSEKIETSVLDKTHVISVSYKNHKAQDGTLILKAKSPKQHDPFDLPPRELKNLIQGIIWRDEHFDGLTIDAIATREGVDRSRVGKMIRNSFDTLQTLLTN
ncbi:MAG: recombinase family protein [Alphaproteobacteria bacterium]